jgi:hypothetical protein
MVAKAAEFNAQQRRCATFASGVARSPSGAFAQRRREGARVHKNAQSALHNRPRRCLTITPVVNRPVDVTDRVDETVTIGVEKTSLIGY